MRRLLTLGALAAGACAVALLAQGLTWRRGAATMLKVLIMMQSVGGGQP